MKRYLAAFALVLAASPAFAWNAAGHRLVAALAWREMSPTARHAAYALLRQHPNYPKWIAKAGETPDYTAFVEAATWADDIRSDRRYHDDKLEASDIPATGLADTACHKNWHYVDFNPDGSIRDGELDRQIERMSRELRATATPMSEKAYVLPWLIHLVGDIHQPLHVGSHKDDGGNGFEIENPFNSRLPFTNLHVWWDDLPGPPWLRGARLEKAVDALLAAHQQAPRQGDVLLWRAESQDIGRSLAYPPAAGSLLPTITAEFRDRAKAIADERLAFAGYRLGRLLERIFNPVSRETE